MPDETPQTEVPKKSRRRTRVSAPVMWPVRALVRYPGRPAPLEILATSIFREGARYIFMTPDRERPYLQRTTIIYDAPGMVIELEQIVTAAPQYQPVASADPASAPLGGGGGSDPGLPPVLRLQQQPQQGHALRSRTGPGVPPASEVRDEHGNVVVVPAAFGMSL